MASTSRLSSRSSGQGSVDQPSDVDVKVANKVITGLSQLIVDTIQHDITRILDSARGKRFIGEGLYGKLHENCSSKDVAREFLDTAMSRFMLDSSEFGEFLALFDDIPSLNIVSKRIREDIDAEMSVNRDCVSDILPGNETREFASAMFLASSSMPDRSLEEVDMVSGPEMRQNTVAVCESATPTVQTMTSQRGFHEESEQEKQFLGRSGISVQAQAATPILSTMPPHSYYDEAHRMITSEKNEARNFVHSIDALPLRQVKEDLEYSQFAPDFDSEVQSTSKNYQNYMTNVEKKEVEMEEIRKTYERSMDDLKEKHKASLKDKDEKMEQEKQLLIEEYEKKYKNLMEEVKKLKEQANISDTNFKMQTMTMTIEYSKQVSNLKDEKSELKDEISLLKDEISKLKDEISKKKDEISKLTQKLNQNIIDEKDRIIKELRDQLLAKGDELHKEVLTDVERSVETGEHS